MISSTVKVAGCLFLFCLMVQAQNPAQKTQTSSVSGKVTVKGSGVSGILVGARTRNSGRPSAPSVTTTDQNGNYRLSNLASGQYEISLAAPQFVLSGTEPMKRVIIGDGEIVENVDFVMVRGGVITGKVVDADGGAVIEEQIEVIPEGPTAEPMTRLGNMSYRTDDRGIYRIFGLPPGKYRVAAGVSPDRLYYGRGRASVYTLTFHPSTTEPAKATLVDVTEGGEATNVDITVRRSMPLFTVTARVVDAETGQPIPDVTYGLQKFRERGSFAMSGMSANGLGEIKLENMTPGKYALFLDPSPKRDVYAEPVSFEVVGQDINDLVIKASSGSSIAGVIVFEEMDEKAARSRFVDLVVFAHSMAQEASSVSGGSAPAARVGPDGSFRAGGLRPGTVHFSLWAQRKTAMTEYEVARIERDGVVQPNLEIKAGEQIKGVRLIVRARTGRIQGVLKFENGQVAKSRVMLSVKRIGDESFQMMELDDRGHFVSQALAAGVYEVRVIAYDGRGKPAEKRQQVVVADNQVTEIMLTLDVKEPPGNDDER
jgi:hypothetical protein